MNTRHKTEWFNDDALWRMLTPLMFSKERCGGVTKSASKALKLVQPKGKHALDLWCELGRWSIPLALRGFRGGRA